MITELTHDIVRIALNEDIRYGIDATTDWLIPQNLEAEGWIESRQDAVVSGLDLVREVFETVDSELRVTFLCNDGATVRPLNRILTISGRAASILKAERTALNFLGHLSGIATRTARAVEISSAWNTQILCTRKTTPGLRHWEVAAVRHGGGDAFRENLSDAILVKDNHLEIIGGLVGLANRVEKTVDGDSILSLGKLEVSSLYELEQAVAMGWKHILLDNFNTDQIAEAVVRFSKNVELEASGGITFENLANFAATCVGSISLGALTHSAKSADFALELESRAPQNLIRDV